MPYNGAITREQFLMRETRLVAQLKADDHLTNEQIVERVTAENLFQYPTARELGSIARACCRRLDALSDDPTTRETLTCLVAHGTLEQARQTNLYANMRAYRLVWEFMFSVVGPRNLALDQALTGSLAECAMYDRKTQTLQPIYLDFELEQGIRANGDEACLPAFNRLN